MNDYIDVMLDEFLESRPYVNGHVTKVYPYDGNTIIVESDDGTFYKYDSILKSTIADYELEYLMSNNIETKNDWESEFSRRLYKLIRREGYTQDSFANAANISGGSISAYIEKRRTPSLFIFLKMTKALNCNLYDILDILCIDCDHAKLYSDIGDHSPVNFKYIENEFRWSKEFAARLYRIYIRTGFNRIEFANEIGTSMSSINKYLKGDRVPNIYFIYSLINIYDLENDDICDLLGIY